MSQDPKDFRNALGQFATGVTVVTTLDSEGNKIGMTANSFSSVSLDPMLVLWSIAKTCKVFDKFTETNHFAIHVLKSDLKDVSNQFASSVDDRFSGVATRISSFVRSAMAWILLFFFAFGSITFATFGVGFSSFTSC